MTSTIYPTDRADAKSLARRLLDAAGKERHDEIRTTSDGPLGLAFDVPEDLAAQVLGDNKVDHDRAAQAGGLANTAMPEAAVEGRWVKSAAGVPEADTGLSPPSAKASRSRPARGK